MQKKKTTSITVFSRFLIIQLFLPSLLFAVFLFLISGTLTVSSIEREQYHIARSIGKIVDDFFADSKLTLKITADTADYSDPEKLTRLLASSQDSNLRMDFIFALDSRGVLRAASPADPKLIGINRSSEPYFILGKSSKDEFWISPPYRETDHGELSIFLSRVTPDGGLIVAKANLQNLIYTINSFVDPQDGRIIFLADQFSNIITQPDPSETIPLNLTDQIIYHFPDGGNLFWRQGRFLIQSSLPIQEANWHVIVQLDPANLLTNYLLTFGVIGLGFLILWWILMLNIRRDFTQTIATPLIELRKYILNLTESNFSNKTRPVRMVAPLGEISDLASSFDEMSLAVYVRQHELQESEKKYRALIDQSGDAIFLQSVNKLLIINPRFTEIFGVAPAQLDEESRTIVDFSTESSRNYVTQMMNRLGQGEINRLRFEFSALSNLGTEIEVEVNASTFPYLGDFAIQGILRDITDRKKIEREEREQRVLAEALRDTASALNSTLNLDEVMDRILENTKLVVPHESSSIMLVEETPAYAKIVAVKGYVGLGMEIWAQNARFQIQKTPTLAAMFNTGRPVAIPDVVTDATWISISEYDWIRSYIGAPIKVKDSIIGFLNLESPIPGYFNLRQAERLQAFADQAGIAIHNAKLLSELTRTNQDLIMAYETTLQGWSKALEIRDYETHGHTMRVLEQTIKLARWIGIPPEDIRNIKYGVLLHDIGKLFIPENILNKKHSLTDEEWRIMRQHPSYAFEVLSPISFLSSSIDIPYCHHEHWDGSGYPRGLKGNQIPLAARIFSIIDIWDALTNDRPYRTKWQYNQTMEYIQGLSGQILDPAIVQSFNEMMSSESNQEGI